MQVSATISEAFNTPVWLLVAACVIGVLQLAWVRAWVKGLFGEFAVKLAAKLCLPPDSYHAIHNVTLPTPDGTTQIDHIVVSRYGIFVVETKNMKGWIFGGQNQNNWTQKLYRKTYTFRKRTVSTVSTAP